LDRLPETRVEAQTIDKTIGEIMEAHPDDPPIQPGETLREWMERRIGTCGE
jgi:hypothetical protein